MPGLVSEPESGRIGRAGPARHASLHLDLGGPAERAWRGEALAAVVRRRAEELRRTLPPPAACGVVALERARPAELLVDVLAALDAGFEAFPLNGGWWPRDRDAVLERLRPAWRLGHAGEAALPVPSGLVWDDGSEDERVPGAHERSNRPAALWVATVGPAGDPSPFGFSGEHVARWCSVPSSAVRSGARVLIVGSPGHGPVLREALAALFAGADVQLTDRAHLAGHLTAGRIDRLVVATPVLRVVLRHLARRGRDVVGVATTITHQGPVRPHERAGFAATLGGDLVEAISVTEAGGWLAVAGSVPDDLLARTHGSDPAGDHDRAAPDAADRGGAGHGHRSGAGAGQLHIDGPGTALLSATAARPTGGWPTGDLVQVGPAGRLTWLGRARDRFLVGDDEVDPVAVEAVIAAHPLVADVAVAPRPHPELGAVVAAVVVPHDPSWPPFLDDLAAVTGVLRPLQRPRALAIVDDLPLHAGGGLHRRLVAFEEAGR